MAHQAVVNNGAGSRGRSNGLMDDVSSFGNDLATLAALQGKLAAADARETMLKAAPAVAALAFAVLLAVAASVALVAALALWIAEAFAMRTPAALLVTGLGAFVVVALLAVVSIKRLASSLATFRRSSEELERNIAWIKTTLTQSGR